MTGRSILITGAGGFVGSHLAEGLLALGYRVTALDRAFDEPTRTRLTGVRLVEAELDAQSLAQAMGDDVDIVIHGAALTTPPEQLGMSALAHIRHNIDLLIDCLDQALAHRARCFIFLSSSGVFAFDEAEQLDEALAPTGTVPYALAKRAGELIAGACPEALILRLGPLYGPHEASRQTRLGVSPVRRWLDCVEAGTALNVTSPQSRRDWTFLPDLAGAIDRLIRADARGVLHLTSGEAIGDLDLARLIASRRAGLDVDITVASEPRRVPMVSNRTDLEGFAWTPLQRGLDLVAEAAR